MQSNRWFTLALLSALGSSAWCFAQVRSEPTAAELAFQSQVKAPIAQTLYKNFVQLRKDAKNQVVGPDGEIAQHPLSRRLDAFAQEVSENLVTSGGVENSGTPIALQIELIRAAFQNTWNLSSRIEAALPRSDAPTPGKCDLATFTRTPEQEALGSSLYDEISANNFVPNPDWLQSAIGNPCYYAIFDPNAVLATSLIPKLNYAKFVAADAYAQITRHFSDFEWAFFKYTVAEISLHYKIFESAADRAKDPNFRWAAQHAYALIEALRLQTYSSARFLLALEAFKTSMQTPIEVSTQADALKGVLLLTYLKSFRLKDESLVRKVSFSPKNQDLINKLFNRVRLRNQTDLSFNASADNLINELLKKAALRVVDLKPTLECLPWLVNHQ